MIERGWQDATHTRFTVDVAGVKIAVAGVDDPHIKYDRYDLIAGPPAPDTALKLGLTHSPEPRVLDAFAADGYDLVLAGTPAAASSGCPCTARSSPTAASTAPAPAAPPGGAATCG